MFFLHKEGVYGHGVFWIGDDLEQGKQASDVAANLDKDDYHDWVLYKFEKPSGDDYEIDHQNERVYTGVRT